MFRSHIQWRSDLVDSIMLIAIGLGLEAWLAPQVWMVSGDIPITPQSLLVVLWGVLWGWKVGGLTALGYLCLGGCGAPVFADGASGWVHFTGSTSGFLLAFPISALAVGWLSEGVKRMPYASAACLLLLGQLVIVLLGLAWQRGIVPGPFTWFETLSQLMPALLIKTALGALAIVCVGRMLSTHRHGGQVGQD